MNQALQFEIKATDLAGRICNLKTRSSLIETPALLPVIHPIRQLLPTREIAAMGYKGVMTNAYTTFIRDPSRAEKDGIHRMIDFDGTIMTDSGGYQVLEFGSVNVSPPEMAKFQERIGSDIAVVLDRPTGLDVTRDFARKTIIDTLKAARETRKIIEREDVAWAVPIQGGKYLDLVSKSAKQSSLLGFECYALGSPVEVLEEYDFPLVVRMILESKKHLQAERPFHLFGAGHPLILPLAIALGCDLFDSASYMLYAKHDRYISSRGTIRLEDLNFLACSCPVCSYYRSGKELKSLPKEERLLALARHNLLVLREVIEGTKQAIWEGRLWEYVKSAAANHPQMVEAFLVASKGAEKDFDFGTPSFKDRGIFVSDSADLDRPEIRRALNSLQRRMDLSKKKDLVILPETKTKPFIVSKLYKEISKIVRTETTLLATLLPIFGLVPAEVSDIFPFSQVNFVRGQFIEGMGPVHFKKRWNSVHILVPDGRDSKQVRRWAREQFGSSSPKISTGYRGFKRNLSQYFGKLRVD